MEEPTSGPAIYGGKNTLHHCRLQVLESNWVYKLLLMKAFLREEVGNSTILSKYQQIIDLMQLQQ